MFSVEWRHNDKFKQDKEKRPAADVYDVMNNGWYGMCRRKCFSSSGWHGTFIHLLPPLFRSVVRNLPPPFSRHARGGVLFGVNWIIKFGRMGPKWPGNGTMKCHAKWRFSW
uniref:Uncharacterized protein n=1 Tax=Globodera rostochiensis TaxID=31243 RepID=A0A914HF42_GLORO